jgi:excisionase family DNA binding protein
MSDKVTKAVFFGQISDPPGGQNEKEFAVNGWEFTNAGNALRLVENSSFKSPSHTIPEVLNDGRLAFSVQETARLLGVSEKSVRRLISRKLLRPSRAMRHHLIAKTEIERFLYDTTLK